MKIVTAFLLVVLVLSARRGEAAEVYAVKAPATEACNDFYVSNRAPLTPNPLVKLPIGAITPRGWLRRQLELMSEGMTGRLPDVSHWCRPEGNGWIEPKKRGWEELPYWLKGFGDLGYVLKDEWIINETSYWIDAAIASQDSDGYFGPRMNKEKHDLWPNMIVLNVLQSLHEATGDERVIPFMTSYFRYQMSLKSEDLLPAFWANIRAGDNLESIYWLYNRTGEPWLLDLAKRIHEQTANWTEEIPTWHGVNICQAFREPAEYYQQARDPKYLRATERNYAEVMGTYGQMPGGMFGADENCRAGYTSPRQAAETCSMVELMHSFEMLLKITGDPVYADRCEEVAFNSFPASQTPDLRGLHYLTAPNMVQLDKENKSPRLQNKGCMLAYSPGERYRCCQHNVGHGWPYYAEEIWHATPDNGLAASLYAACEVEAKVGDGTTVRIIETTDYPFDEIVSLTVRCPKPVPFPLHLRVPRWCDAPNLAINGKPVTVSAEPSSYIVIDRTFADGDTVAVQFPMRVAVTVWAKNGNAVSVSRGPLSYSLKIGERWERFGGTDEWPEYEVYPTTPWNYGLVLDAVDPAGSFEVVRKPGKLAAQPFNVDTAPLELRARACRIPEWQMEDGLVGPISSLPSPVVTNEPVEMVTLIPMGCARLRISAFPTVRTDSVTSIGKGT